MSDKDNKATIRAEDKAAKKQEKGSKKAANSEARQEKYERLRANVPRRRTGYVLFILAAVVLFAAAILDILFLDEVLYWGVIVLFAVLILWAILLLFSRKSAEERVKKASTSDQEFLRCPACRHVFSFEMNHESRSDVVFSCPECGTPGRLPGTDEDLHPAAVPGGGKRGPRFLCGDCGETWSVGALGHDPKAEVHFQACPHCGSDKDLRRVVEEEEMEFSAVPGDA